MSHPDWVLKHKIPGTQITKINGRYYLYKVSSQYNKTKKRSQKKTEEYLGVITKEGLIPPKRKMISVNASMNKDLNEKIAVKEYGACFFLLNSSEDIQIELKKIFPDTYYL
ncbi:MAG: hypothetical protein HPY74_15360 [Firmicutes bacterium]|nr:hypothetical protein [Bacillota bacterium]